MSLHIVNRGGVSKQTSFCNFRFLLLTFIFFLLTKTAFKFSYSSPSRYIKKPSKKNFFYIVNKKQYENQSTKYYGI